MGLDQYLFKTKQTPEQVLSEDYDSNQSKEIAYWRKHPNLQGYMKQVWEQKYQERVKHLQETQENSFGDNQFNCEKVILTIEDLDNWEKAVNNKEYPPTTGFFFGSEKDEEYKEHDLETIKEAREAINEGYTIYYDSWW